MPDPLAGRVVVVTGGGHGAAQELSLGLADLGATVSVVGPPDVDLEDRHAAEAAFAEVASTLGPVHVVVHAHLDPVSLQRQPLADTDGDHWDRRCEALVRCGLACLQAAHTQLRDHGGRILLVTPTVAMTGSAELVPLATAIEAMRAMAKSAARQWGARGITVNCVAPVLEEASNLGLAPPALGRTPDWRRDLAGVVAMLAGDLGGVVTGTTVPVDGGVMMP